MLVGEYSDGRYKRDVMRGRRPSWGRVGARRVDRVSLSIILYEDRKGKAYDSNRAGAQPASRREV